MAVTLSLSITQNSQSIDNNTSNVTVKATVAWTYGSWNATGKCYGSITIDGTKYSWTGLTFNTSAKTSGSQTIMTKTVNVSHNSDGSKTLNCSASFYTGVSSGTVTDTASKTLTTIPRATTPTLSPASTNMGSTVTISLPRASSDFTHNLAYKFGSESSYTSIATGVGTSYTWTVPDKATSIPAATSGQFTIRVQTVNDGDVIGTEYAYLTGKVPTSVVPTVSALTLAEATTGLASQYGAYIQNKSTLAVSITAAGAKGSTISAYQTLLQGKTYTTKSFTSDLLTSSGTLTVKTRVKDSRGRWSEYKTTSITVLAYSKPKITVFRGWRCNSAGSATDDGVYLSVDCSVQFPSLNGGNDSTILMEYKRNAETDYEELYSSNIYADTSAVTTETDGIQLFASPTFSIDYQYDLRLTVTDSFGTTSTYTTTLPSGAVILDLAADGLGIAFGKTSEQPGVEFGWNIAGSARSFGSLSGQHRTHDGLLIQWGTVTITPTAVDTPTTVLITFPLPYAATPLVYTTPVSSVPQNISTAIQRTVSVVTDSKLRVGITLTRNGLTDTVIQWLAIGKGVDT